MFCTPCLAVLPTHFSQLDLNLANLEATVEAEWILAFLFLRKRHFSMTSSLRSVVQVVMAHFTIFQSHGLSRWFRTKIMKSCLNLSLFSKHSELILSSHLNNFYLRQSRRWMFLPMSVCLSVSKITQKRVHGFGWDVACRQMLGHARTD